MRRWGFWAIRLSFAVIFIWFGILKPLGLSAAAPLVLDTVSWMPLLESETWLSVIGWWEVLIGITFLFKSTTRFAVGLLFLQKLAQAAREHGISGLVAYTAPHNQGMIKLFKKLPYKIKTAFDGEALSLSCRFEDLSNG